MNDGPDRIDNYWLFAVNCVEKYNNPFSFKKTITVALRSNEICALIK